MSKRTTSDQAEPVHEPLPEVTPAQALEAENLRLQVEHEARVAEGDPEA